MNQSSLKPKIPKTPIPCPGTYTWGKGRKVCQKFGIGKTKLLELRDNWWLAGFEYIRENDTSISYNLTLISHWWVHRQEPALHDQARETYANYLKNLRK